MINVTIADGRKDLCQWDIDRILKIDGAPDGSTVNFINKEDESPLPVLLENGTVTIPNSLLQVPRLFLKLYVWHNDHTIGTARLRVIVQPKPDGYMATEDEILTWDKLFNECGRYTPHVAEDGTLSWTKSKDTMEDVPAVNIRGPKGEDAKVIIRTWTDADIV